MKTENKIHNHRRRVPLKEVPMLPDYACWTEPALRHLIFKATPRVNSKGEKMPTNGLAESGAIIRIGRKILIDIDCFDRWIEGHKTSNQQMGVKNA